MYKHILVPTDGSPLSLKAVEAATELARGMKAKITALHVIAPYSPPVIGDAVINYESLMSPAEYKKSSEKRAQDMLDKVKAEAAVHKVQCDTAFVSDTQPWDAIVKAAKGKKCDLIVMASHGRRGLEALLLGSETNKVLTHSKTPVLVCR
jgi:nucleotide-binding universal stress UspA family protein